MRSKFAHTSLRHETNTQEEDAEATQVTEYTYSYVPKPITYTKGKPLAQQLLVGGEFSSHTENRDKYVEHPVPRVCVRQRVVWNGQATPFDGVTTQRQDFPAWKITRRVAQKSQPAMPTAGKFESETTNRSDFKGESGGERYRRAPEAYVKNTSCFEGATTNKEDYKAWDTNAMATHVKKNEIYVCVKDDRDFKSTTSAMFTDAPVQIVNVPRLPKLEKAQIPKSEASSNYVSTSQQDFVSWPVKKRPPREKVAWFPNHAKLQGETTYSASHDASRLDNVLFEPRKIVYQRFASAPFDGITTQRHDFIKHGILKGGKIMDFAPKRLYVSHKDDRDFVTTSALSYHEKVPV